VAGGRRNRKRSGPFELDSQLIEISLGHLVVDESGSHGWSRETKERRRGGAERRE